jgi:protein-tyrosine-phosphatase
MRMMITIDADLCRSQLAERVLEDMIRSKWPVGKMLPANTTSRNRRVAHVCHAAGLPKPANMEAVYQFLRDKNIVIV